LKHRATYPRAAELNQPHHRFASSTGPRPQFVEAVVEFRQDIFNCFSRRLAMEPLLNALRERDAGISRRMRTKLQPAQNRRLRLFDLLHVVAQSLDQRAEFTLGATFERLDPKFKPRLPVGECVGGCCRGVRHG
jgi:hypothetical protein